MTFSNSDFKDKMFSDLVFKKCLFNYAKSFEESMWNDSDGMIEFSQYDTDNLDSDYQKWHKTKDFIASNTQWLYVDFQDNLYGVLNQFVVQCDNEGTFFCFCKEFHNIPFMFAQSTELSELMSLRAKKHQTDYSTLLNEYTLLCEKESFIIDTHDYTVEFEEFVAKNI